VLGSGQAKVSSNVLRQVEQTDLIQYGLIPEFVGRFPVISSLQVRESHFAKPSSRLQLLAISRLCIQVPKWQLGWKFWA